MLTELREKVAQGLVTERLHPDYPELSIFNYTPEVQYKKLWDEYTKAARGLVLNNVTGEVLARPFPKFFNLAEHDPSEIPMTLPLVFEKLDGSLGIIFSYNGVNIVATRGSFASKQAIEAAKLLKGTDLGLVPKGYTVLCEIIYPKNKIVVDYGDSRTLVYLGTINNKSGKFQFMNLGLPASASEFYYTAPKDLPTVKENTEGYVLFWPEHNFRVKVKLDEYVRLHKILTGYNLRRLWEHVSEGGSLEGFITKGDVPDEFFKQVEEDFEYLFECYDRVWESARYAFQCVDRLETRKEQAKVLTSCFEKQAAVVFKWLDDKPVSELIWKAVKEEYNI